MRKARQNRSEICHRGFFKTDHYREHTDSNRPGGKKNEAMNMNAGGKSESRLFSAVKLTDATVFAINS
ncbi:hypothetical protein [Edaphobacter sp.]|uniref:hypothetical protein n=1 Tax=Edaphobacter sp. TaxID=1934404 RepID=UPI002DB571F0|nr:hypothetical protein [Edaphobacter sp.]HEU5340967.1 hypothetical protein [Edaphobacter sp.]